jgi:hypothetical protein
LVPISTENKGDACTQKTQRLWLLIGNSVLKGLTFLQAIATAQVSLCMDTLATSASNSRNSVGGEDAEASIQPWKSQVVPADHN